VASPVERGWLENELWGDPVSYDTYRHIIAHGRPAVIGAYRKCFDSDRLDALVTPTTQTTSWNLTPITYQVGSPMPVCPCAVVQRCAKSRHRLLQVDSNR